MATNDRTRQFRVGLLVIACSATFITLLAFIAGAALDRDVYSYFILYEENVKGMVVGSKVNFQGVPIGSVHDIRFQEGQTLVEVRVDPQKALIQDVTLARLDRLLVTGQVTVELEGYAPGAPRLPDGSFIAAAATDPIQELKTSLPTLIDEFDGLLRQSTATMERVDRVLSDENLGRLERILGHVEDGMAVLPGEIEATAAELRATLAAVRPLADEARTTLGKVAEATDRAAEVAVRTGDGLDRALADGRRTLLRFEAMADGLLRVAEEAEGVLGNNRHTLRTMLVGAADAMREFQALARQLRAAPNAVLFGAEQPELDLPAVPASGGRE